MKLIQFGTASDAAIQGNLTHRSTIMPRLVLALDLLDETLKKFKNEKSKITKQNKFNFKFCDDFDNSDFTSIQHEKIITIAVESLIKIKKRISCLSGIESIPFVLPSTIPVIRTISSQIFSSFPLYSENLWMLSSLLGGVIMDSATITGAKFDFQKSNLESNHILDEAKLMVDSKINKQYPNLPLLKVDNAWSF